MKEVLSKEMPLNMPRRVIRHNVSIADGLRVEVPQRSHIIGVELNDRDSLTMDVWLEIPADDGDDDGGVMDVIFTVFGIGHVIPAGGERRPMYRHLGSVRDFHAGFAWHLYAAVVDWRA